MRRLKSFSQLPESSLNSSRREEDSTPAIFYLIFFGKSEKRENILVSGFSVVHLQFDVDEKLNSGTYVVLQLLGFGNITG